MAKGKTATIKQPDPNSKTSKRRKNRGFKSLELSSRKHRRAKRRSINSLMQYGKILKPGEKIDNGANSFVHTGGGSICYW